MTIEEIKSLCDRLEAAKAELDAAEARLNACNLSGHQHSITVSVGGLGSVALTEIERSTGYSARLIRGREMIMLGVKKALADIRDKQLLHVRKLEKLIAEAKVTL